jgi:hypothetical protein
VRESGVSERENFSITKQDRVRNNFYFTQSCRKFIELNLLIVENCTKVIQNQMKLLSNSL